MPYQPAPFFHVRPAYQREASGPPRPPRPPRRRARVSLRVAFAVLVVSTLILGLAAVALARPTSAHLSRQGWVTLEAFQNMPGQLHPEDLDRVHGQLQTLVVRCSNLPGRGAQSTAIRRMCKQTMRFLDQSVGIASCDDARAATCLTGRLPGYDQAMDGEVGASLTVAATLLPGRCRTEFETEARRGAAVSAAGRTLRGALVAGDPDATKKATSAFSRALDRWSEDPVDGEPCRPVA